MARELMSPLDNDDSNEKVKCDENDTMGSDNRRTHNVLINGSNASNQADKQLHGSAMPTNTAAMSSSLNSNLSFSSFRSQQFDDSAPSFFNRNNHNQHTYRESRYAHRTIQDELSPGQPLNLSQAFSSLKNKMLEEKVPEQVKIRRRRMKPSEAKAMKRYRHRKLNFNRFVSKTIAEVMEIYESTK